MTKYLRPEEKTPAKCAAWPEQAGVAFIEHYVGQETLTTIAFSDQAPADPNDKRATLAYWTGEHDTRLTVTYKGFPDAPGKLIEYPRERVVSVERRTIMHPREHDWMVNRDTRPDKASDHFRGYQLEYVKDNARYDAGWLAWCEGCDTAREATPEEIASAQPELYDAGDGRMVTVPDYEPDPRD